MKHRFYPLIVLTLIAVLVVTGCAPATQTAAPSVTDATNAPVTLPSEEEATEAAARFTIQADESIQSVITSLYSALFAGELPVFIEEDAELIVQAAPEDEAFSMASLPATFLPGWQLIPQSENADLTNFIGFTVSPDGQQVLIDLGELPTSITLTDQAGNTVEYPQPIHRVISAYGPQPLWCTVWVQAAAW